MSLIWFDENVIVNIGFEEEISLEHMKKNTYVSKIYLKNKIYTGALVLAIITFDNNFSLPFAIKCSTNNSEIGRLERIL